MSAIKPTEPLGFLRRTLFSCSQNVKERAYTGIVRPVLEYGNSVWDPQIDGLNDKLEKEQKCVGLNLGIIPLKKEV